MRSLLPLEILNTTNSKRRQKSVCLSFRRTNRRPPLSGPKKPKGQKETQHTSGPSGRSVATEQDRTDWNMRRTATNVTTIQRRSCQRFRWFSTFPTHLHFHYSPPIPKRCLPNHTTRRRFFQGFRRPTKQAVGYHHGVRLFCRATASTAPFTVRKPSNRIASFLSRNQN